ncbi:unnamed protein product [Discosporangium mesarthrocarpum]
MKTACAAAVMATLGCANAFVPSAPLSNVGRSVSKTRMAAEMSKSLPMLPRPPLLDGSMAGDVGFDPLGLSESQGVGVDLYWLREAELKHGRVAMLAVTGTLWCDQVGSLPGFPSGTNQVELFWQVFAEKPQYIAAGIIFIGIAELISGVATTTGRETGERAPGDFGIDPLKLSEKPESFKRMQTQEIKHCRLAMWAAAGQLLQGVTTHASAMDNLNVSVTCDGKGGGLVFDSLHITIAKTKVVQVLILDWRRLPLIRSNFGQVMECYYVVSICE